MVTKTAEEVALLTPAQRVEHYAAEAEVVFGKGFQRDRQGRPIEVGHGAPGHETEQHFAALEKYEGKEAADRARAEAAKRRS